MRIIFFGSGEFGRLTLGWLAQSEHELLQIVTQPARPAGRGRKIVRTLIAQLAERLDLPVVESPDVNQADFIARISALQPQIIMVIAFGQKIGPALLSLSDCRVINLHGSLLPAYRGAAPINWAIINSEKQTGLTIIELDETWDGGAILGQKATGIGPTETAGELHDRLAEMGPALMAQVLDQIARGVDQPLVQDARRASRAPKLRKADAAVAWNQPARQICSKINGMWPWPGAYCFLRQANSDKFERLTLARAELGPVASDSEPGDSNNRAPAGRLADDLSITCGRGRLRLLELKPENGKLMSFADFVNGRRLQPGDQFANDPQSR